MTDQIAALDAHLDATHDARLESYKAFLRIPSISALPVHAPDCRRAAEWLADALARGRARARRGRRDRRASGRLCRLAARRRARRRSSSTATTTSSRSIRSMSGRRRRSSRSSTATGCSRRGAADDKGQVHAHVMAAAADARDAGRVPGQRPVRLRGRGGVELGPPRRVARGEQGPPARRRRDHQRQRVLRGQPAGDHHRPARDDVRAGRRPGRARSTCIRAGSAASSRTRRTRSPGSSPALKGPDGRILIPGFYDDVVALDRGRPRGDRRAAVRRGRPRGIDRGVRRSSARSGTRSSSDAAPARRSTSTASGAGSRATAARPSSRPTRTPRSAAGSWRTRIPTGSSSCSAPTSRRSRRPA